MKEHGLSKVSEIEDKYDELHNRRDNALFILNQYDHRIEALDEHIRQGEIYRQHRNLHAEYMQLRPHKQRKFYEAHHAELTLFEAADQYFKDNHIETDFSISEWKDERVRMSAKNNEAYREYSAAARDYAKIVDRC